MSIIPTIEEIIEKMVEANKELNNHKIAVATFALKRRREEELKTLEALKDELKLKDENLSELTHGIPIEKAKELDLVLISGWDQSSSDGQLWRSYKKAEVAVVKWTVVPFLNWAGEHHWFDENNGVIYKNPKAFFIPPSPHRTHKHRNR